jgi:glycine/D-amino acid oxidase-like deaminating enzyme
MTQSYWEIASFRKQWDLVVVGAGITGCSSVLELKKLYPDWQILMLERGYYPSGASTRNAGFACFGSVSELLDDLEHNSENDVKALVAKRYHGLQLLRETVPAVVMDFDLCGGHELFTDEHTYDPCIHSLIRMNTWIEDIAGEKDVYEARTVNGYRTIFNRFEGYLHSGKLVSWLHQQVKEVGVEIRWNCPVRSASTGKVVLENGTEIDTKRIILATNGFSREVADRSNVRPARGLVLVTNELENIPWRGTWHYDKGFVYFRNIGNRLLLGGGRNQDMKREESTDDVVNPTVKAYLIEFIRDVLKLEGNWAIEHEWTGIMGFSTSKNPVLDEIEESVWLAAGLGGMGVALGMQFGKDVAAKVALSQMKA